MTKHRLVSPQWILVADQDRLVRELWCDVLTRAGYRTLQADSWPQALELMRIVIPHLVILDLHMTGFIGDGGLHHVLLQIPVLMVCSFLDDEPDDASPASGSTSSGGCRSPNSPPRCSQPSGRRWRISADNIALTRDPGPAVPPAGPACSPSAASPPRRP